MNLIFEIPGIPQPQGSTSSFRTKSGKIVTTSANKNLKPWRSDAIVLAKAARRGGPTIEGAVALHVEFYFPRPLFHFGTGRNAGQLRPAAPAWMTVKPDLDKLVRAVKDALTQALVYRDDSQVVHVDADKRWATNFVGTMVSVREVVSRVAELSA